MTNAYQNWRPGPANWTWLGSAWANLPTAEGYRMQLQVSAEARTTAPNDPSGNSHRVRLDNMRIEGT